MKIIRCAFPLLFVICLVFSAPLELYASSTLQSVDEDWIVVHFTEIVADNVKPRFPEEFLEKFLKGNASAELLIFVLTDVDPSTKFRTAYMIPYRSTSTDDALSEISVSSNDIERINLGTTGLSMAIPRNGVESANITIQVFETTTFRAIVEEFSSQAAESSPFLNSVATILQTLASNPFAKGLQNRGVPAASFASNILVGAAWNEIFKDVLLAEQKIALSRDHSGLNHETPIPLKNEWGVVTLKYSVRTAYAVGAPTFDTVLGSTTQHQVIYDGDPRDNLRSERGQKAIVCSGFESECEFGDCPNKKRIMWGPYCRAENNPAVRPGAYRVTLKGSGNVRAGATDFGTSGSLFGFGQHELALPASYSFCWPGRAQGGWGFETIVQSIGESASVDGIRIEYIGACTVGQ